MSETYVPPRIKGKMVKVKRKSKKEKLDELLGENLLGISHSGDETIINVKEDVTLTQSDLEKIRRILEAE